MSIFDVAMEKERQMQSLYQDLASNCDNEGLKKALLMLADQEGKHFHDLERVSEQVEDDEDYDLVSDMREIFQQIKQKRELMKLNTNQLELYKEVRDFEKVNEEFYREKSQEMTDPKLKKLLSSFADEEKKHYHLMCEIVDFVERPNVWVEHAEFNHLEDY